MRRMSNSLKKTPTTTKSSIDAAMIESVGQRQYEIFLLPLEMLNKFKMTIDFHRTNQTKQQQEQNSNAFSNNLLSL